MNTSYAEKRAREAWEARINHRKASNTWAEVADELNVTEPLSMFVCEIHARWMSAYADADAAAERAFRELAVAMRGADVSDQARGRLELPERAHQRGRCAVTDESVCSVCSRLTGFGDEERFEPPVNLARCPAPGSMECRAVAQAVAPWRRENETLRSNCDHLSSENASLARQVESMAMRIESLAEELAKPEDVRLREVLDALDGRAVIFDGLGARVGHLLDEMDEWIGRAGEAERLAEERLAHANQLQADIEAEMQGRL